MKSVKIIITTLLTVIVSAISLYTGRMYEEQYFGDKSLEYQQLKDSCQKHYEAACLQADFIRSLMDWDFNQTGPSIGTEIEESWYEWYQDLPLGNYKTQFIKDIKDFNQYS